jgi:hypothetical protein
MINLKQLYKKPKVFERLTGLSPVKFQQLLAELEPLFNQAEIKRKSYSNRKRKIGAGPKSKLSLGQALFILLLYYRTYVNHIFIGMLADINDSNVCRYFRKVEPLLAQIFKIPVSKIKMSEDEIMEIIIDATEQESEKRPGSGYSGKKKKQTVKTQIAVTSDGKIKSVSKCINGNRHDKKLYDQTRIFTDKKVKRKGDLGYVGTSCRIPIKKQKKKELTNEQKEYNKQFSQERIIVEHVFAHLKKFRILSYKFRNDINGYYLIFKNIAGLRNLQIA